MIVTTKCFMKCDGCVFNNQTSEDIPLSKIISTSKNLYKDGYRKITITGGDPLYRKDLREIVDSFYDTGFRIHLDTTGFPLLKEFSLKGLEHKISLIGIPLDGSTNRIHQEFRTNSTIEIKDIKKIIKLLEENGFRISINTVVHNGNLNDLQNIYNIITKYKGVKRWELHQFSTAMSTREDLRINNSDFKNAISKIENKKNIRISPKYSRQKFGANVIPF